MIPTDTIENSIRCGNICISCLFVVVTLLSAVHFHELPLLRRKQRRPIRKKMKGWNSVSSMSSVHCPPLQLQSIPSNLQLHVKRYALNISHPMPSRFDEQILCTCRYTLMRTHTCSITYTPKPTPTPTHTRARAHIYTYIHPLVFDTGNFLKQMFTYYILIFVFR